MSCKCCNIAGAETSVGELPPTPFFIPIIFWSINLLTWGVLGQFLLDRKGEGGLCSPQPVWPDVEIKSSQSFPKVAPAQKNNNQQQY